MDIARRLLVTLVAAAAVTAAQAAPATEAGPMATAPSGTTGAPPATGEVSVGDQIDAYLKTSPAAALPRDAATGVTGAEEPRKVHGVVDVAVGSNGYRSAYVRSDLPVGKTGTLSIAVGESKINGRAGGYGGYGAYGGRFGGGDRQSLAVALSLGEPALDPHDPRCHLAGEERREARYDPQVEGGRPRACQAADARTSSPPQ
jgi:hypothetical protein